MPVARARVHVLGMAARVVQDDCLFSVFVASPDGVYQNSTSIFLLHQIERLICSAHSESGAELRNTH